MVTMLKRVQTAIECMPWDGNRPLNIHDDAEAIARFAIHAMREPSVAMVRALDAAWPNRTEVSAYQRMIDEALRE